MAGVAVVGSGNYQLEVDTGFTQDAFLLNDATAGVLNNTTYVLNGTTNYASVLNGCTNVSVKRGRRDVGDQFSAGTMSFTMLDTSGVFNPFDEESPYWDPTTELPGLAPMRKVRLSRYSATDVKEYLFVGYIVNYDYNFALGGIDTVTVFCADQFYLLAQTALDAINPSQQLSSARLTTILDRPEVNFPATQRDITTGTVTLGSSAAFNIDAGTNTLEYCMQINEAEQGRLFMSRDGDITFQSRIGNTLSASSANFYDNGTNIKYDQVGITFEADQVVNRASVTIMGSSPQVASDAASQTKYFIQQKTIQDSLLYNDASAATLADYLLDPEPVARYTSVGTQFNMLTSAQRDSLAVLEIGNTIKVLKTFDSGSGTSTLSQELAIEGIEHTLSLSSGHSVMYFTSPTTIVYNLILDDAVYGILNSTNVLG